MGVKQLRQERSNPLNHTLTAIAIVAIELFSPPSIQYLYFCSWIIIGNLQRILVEDIRLSTMSTFLATALYDSREDADVTLKCQGFDIKAHSLVLETRSAYFKTALNTDVGSHRGEKVIDVRECHPLVLEMVVNFVYDIDLPEDFNFQDFEGLLFMADFYHMEDLKGAVALHVSNHWNETNILALSQLAEKYKAEKMQVVCCDYILINLDILGKNLLDQLFMALPLLGRKSWDRLNDTMPRGVEIANTRCWSSTSRPWLTTSPRERTSWATPTRPGLATKPMSELTSSKTCSWCATRPLSGATIKPGTRSRCRKERSAVSSNLGLTDSRW